MSLSLILEALFSCDVPSGRSTNNPTSWAEHIPELVAQGLLEKVKTEVEGGWRQYDWFKTTETGREFYRMNAAPVEW